MEGGRVIHSWCMGAVSHSYGWFGEGRDGGGGWQACRTKPGGDDCRSGDVVALSACELKTLMLMITPLSMCAALGRVEPELVCLPGKALAQGVTRRFWFEVHAVGCPYFMVLHGYKGCY